MAALVDEGKDIPEGTGKIHQNERLAVIRSVAVCARCFALILVAVYPALFEDSLSESVKRSRDTEWEN